MKKNKAYFQVKNLSHRYTRQNINTFENINLEIAKGDVLCLLGPSGCGKSTLLRCLSGFETPIQGDILVAGETLFSHGINVLPEKRNIGLVFQNCVLFPHLNIEQNITFGIQHLSKMKRNLIKDDLIDMIGLAGYEKKFPAELSGGEQQRIAIARALAPHPKILLFDEPLSHLDQEMRVKLRQELRDILKAKSMTAVFVTHDQEEAFDLGDHIGIFHQGNICQIGSAPWLYHCPQNTYVANFIGSGFFLPGRVKDSKSKVAITPIGDIPIKPNGPTGKVEIYLPAAHLSITKEQVSLPFFFEARISKKFFRGDHYAYNLYIQAIDRTFSHFTSHQDLSEGEDIFLKIHLKNIARVFPHSSK